MTEAERIDKGFAAQRALDSFLDPAFDVVRAEYEARLRALCASKPWAHNEIAALANATRIVDEVRGQIAMLIVDGEAAQAGKDRARRIEELTPAKRRLLHIGGF